MNNTGIRAGAAVVAILTLVGVTACGSDAGTPPGTRGTTAPVTPAASSPQPPADPVVVARRQAEAAYRGMWKAYTDASRIPDPQHPDLARYASGDALQLLTKAVTQAKEQGLGERGDVFLIPGVAGLRDGVPLTKATVNDCVDTSATVMYKLDGSAYHDTPGGKRTMLATLEVIDGSWKVTGFGLHDVGTCA